MMNLTKDLACLIYREDVLLPVIVDQTAIGDVQVISANVPMEGKSFSASLFLDLAHKSSVFSYLYIRIYLFLTFYSLFLV